MENKVTKVRTSTNITGQINGVDVTLNYDVAEVGVKPTSMSIWANVMEPLVEGQDPMQRKGTSVNVSIDALGRKNINVNGERIVTEMTALVEAMVNEIQAVWDTL